MIPEIEFKLNSLYSTIPLIHRNNLSYLENKIHKQSMTMPDEMLVLVKLKEMKYLGLKLLVDSKTILVCSLLSYLIYVKHKVKLLELPTYSYN